MVVAFKLPDEDKRKQNDGADAPFRVTPYPKKRLKGSSLEAEDIDSSTQLQPKRLVNITANISDESMSPETVEDAPTATNGQNCTNHDGIEIEGASFANNSTNDNSACDAAPAGENEEEDQEWGEFVVQFQEQPPDDVGLQEDFENFLHGKKRRENAKKNLASALERCNGRLQSYAESIIQENALPIHSANRERLDVLDADIKEYFVQNHSRRIRMQTSLDEFKKVSESIINNLMARTINSQNPPPIAQTSDESTDEEGATDENGEPNWEILCQYGQSRESIELFRNGREVRLPHAEDQFYKGVTRIHGIFKYNVEAILSVAVDVYQSQEEALDMLEADVQSHMIQNFKRRIVFKKMLEESAKERERVYSFLHARVSRLGLPISASNEHS